METNNERPQTDVRQLLGIVLARPADVVRMSAADLNLTLRVSRRVRLHGWLAAKLKEADVLNQLPVTAQDQLESALIMAHSRARLAKWELNRIAWALQDEPAVPLVLMKGCSYLLLDLPNSPGRIFADVDLLLPENELERVEEILNKRGWRTTELTPYDQNYYRKWTHELPPLVHVEREVEIDLHHNVLPRTSRLKPPSDALIRNAVPVEDSRYQVFASEIMALHAMTHLMFNDDLTDKLRDLVDIDVLLRHFSNEDSEFWKRLLRKAEELDLRRPAYYSLRYVRQLLNCPIPDAVTDTAQKWAPPAPIVWLMDRLVPLALYPPHPDYPSHLTEVGRLLLYVRSHWIRMPPWLLAYHLSHKILATKAGLFRTDKST